MRPQIGWGGAQPRGGASLPTCFSSGQPPAHANRLNLLLRLACKNARETRCNTRAHRLHGLAMCNVAVHEPPSFKKGSLQVYTPHLVGFLTSSTDSPRSEF